MTNQLFAPLKLRHTTFPNRVWVSPMCQYSADNGIVGSWHQAHIGALATGAPGLILMEASAVSPEGRISIACPGLWNDQQAAAFKPLVDFAHSQHVPVGIQLAHAGRKGSTMRPWDDHLIATAAEGGWQTVSASPVAFNNMPTPTELTVTQIQELVSKFAQAAKRAQAVGFDVIEIHAAHGYLLHQFYSPLSNSRTDEYGGSFENRVRFLLEVTKAVRSEIGEHTVLFVRISATDWVADGWNIDDSVKLAAELKKLGVDLIDVSSGGTVHNAQIPVGPGYQVDFAHRIKSDAQIPTSAVGMITQASQANEIITSSKADAVMLARAMLRNPRWAMQAAEELGEVIAWPNQLARGRTVTN
jgi:2,4-dienoyl-CoA reductase-like NADH-dependent reductase (Old Yellow Enzyme family)